VNVASNPFGRYSVWQGGSMMGMEKGFDKIYHTREEYFEKGSSIARHNAVFAPGS